MAKFTWKLPFELPVQIKSVKCFPIALNLCLNSHENEKWGLPNAGRIDSEASEKRGC